jgi:hypothetical protein
MMGQHPFWHICGLSLFIFLIVCNSRSRSAGILVIALWNLPGVILHEFAHLLVGFIFCAGPRNISFIPRRAGNGWRLGCAGFSRINAFNAVPVALAPLGLTLIAWLLARNWFHWFRPSLCSTLTFYLTLFILLYSSLPSRRDIMVACNLKSVILYTLLLAAGFLIFRGAPLRHAFPEGLLPVKLLRAGQTVSKRC